MKTEAATGIVVLVFVLVSGVFDGRALGTVELTEVSNHHVAGINADMPYVAGYHVNTRDLRTRENVDAVAVTVSFSSTNASFFPSGSWLGAGIFVQAQDSRYRHVDYGFYITLVLDASGDLFVDLGLHQTREGTIPLQMPTADLKYAYTWRLSGIDLAEPVILSATWDEDGYVLYSISVSGEHFSLVSVNVAGLPNCENIIRRFYAGNAIVEPFPISRYVNFFQFGVISPTVIASNQWRASLKEPKMLRKDGWVLVDKAWSTDGDMAFLDWDWRWGGAPYDGANAEYYRHGIEDPYEAVFFYDGRTLAPATVLWEYQPELKYSPNNAQWSISAAIVFLWATFGLFRVRKMGF